MEDRLEDHLEVLREKTAAQWKILKDLHQQYLSVAADLGATADKTTKVASQSAAVSVEASMVHPCVDTLKISTLDKN